MTWRDKYKVHPAADIFPMMSDEELATLGADINANGLNMPILFWQGADGPLLIDGRNRYEAMERIGLDPSEHGELVLHENPFPISTIISLNIHRRHLTKAQQADLIVAAHKASRQVDEVPKQRHVKGKAGSQKDEFKTAVVADAGKHGTSQSTVERAMAKAEWTPEEIEARRQKFADQAARRDERTRERQEYKAEQKRERESNLAEALAILEQLPFDTAIRLVDLLMREAVCCNVSMALYDKQSERDEARSDLDDLLEEEAAKKAAPKKKPAPQKKTCRQCHGAGTITSKTTGMTVDCDCVRNGAARG